MQSFQIENNQAGQRLDKFLNKYLPAAGTSFLYKMLRKKNIVLNGKKAEGKEILAVGDTVSFFFSEETFLKFRGSVSAAEKEEGTAEFLHAYRSLKGIQIIYEDENILILNKPAGILSQRAEANQDSLNEWMIGYLLTNKKLTGESLQTFKPSVLNRLDRNTSGLVLCGISLPGSQMLSRLLHDRTLHKYYRTIVKGQITKAEEITAVLKKDSLQNKVRVTADGEGSVIRTAYRPVSHGKVSCGKASPKKGFWDYTQLEVNLITGKTHQIRAHLASIGHPVLGDAKYGDRAFNQAFSCKPSYQLLHAQRVEFPKLPAPFEDLSGRIFEAELPPIFLEVLK